MDAGEATLEVKPELKNFGNRDCYHVVGTGRSVGAFDWFFKVRDRYESVIDKDAMLLWLFIRRVNEGGYIINQNVSFNHYSDSAKSEKATISIPENTRDLVSAFYYARTIDFSNAKEGDIFPINGYLDDAIFLMNISTSARKRSRPRWAPSGHQVPSDAGRRPRVQGQRGHDRLGQRRSQPHSVRVQTDILVGSIKMDLVGYENPANQPAIVGEVIFLFSVSLEQMQSGVGGSGHCPIHGMMVLNPCLWTVPDSLIFTWFTRC